MNNQDSRRKNLGRFLIPSIIGLFLFIVPLPYGGMAPNIGVGYMATIIKGAWGAKLPTFMIVVVIVSAVLTVLATLLKPEFIKQNEFWSSMLIVSPVQTVIRALAAAFGIIIMGKIDQGVFAMVSNKFTGGVVANDLFPVLATWFFFSGFFLPLLMEFGLMDFFGTLIRRIMRPLFKVPGRSAIDAIASWIGSGPVGIVITDKQYKEGFYTAKEAAIISVCFSLVSLPFSVFIAGFLNITKNFMLFYGAIAISSFVAAIILPRIYPLRQKKDEYMEGIEVRIKEEVPEGYTTFNWALEKGMERAKLAPNFVGLVRAGLKTVIDVYFSLMPIVLFLGTIALIVSEYTSVFAIIAKPLVPIYEMIGIPDAAVAASATVVGFADQFLPAVFIQGSEYEITRFIIGALSFTQLIYMTETGAIILRSKIPVSFVDLFVIFVERTIITLPIVILIANLIY